MGVYFDRVLLVCLMTAAAIALIGLIGLTAIAGRAGFGFGVALLIVGGVGFSVADDVWVQWNERTSGGDPR